MMIGALQHLVSLKLAYILTMLLGLVLLIIGFFRFVNIWAPKAAFLATFLLVISTGVIETIHSFGQ